MKKIAISLLTVFFFFFCREVLAYDLTLTAVGNQSTLGTDYSVVNFVGGVPTLTGTASPSAQVGININTVLQYTTASTSGVWQYIPSSLNQGNNTVVLSSGTQSISFNLRFNATDSATTATPAALPTESELPGTGVWEYYIPAILMGLVVLGAGRYGRKWMQKWEKGD